MAIVLKNDVDKDAGTNRPLQLAVYFRETNFSTNVNVAFASTTPIEADPGYSFSVTAPSGKDLTVSSGRNDNAYSMIHSLGTGTIEFEFDLSRRCAMDEPGVYQIVAQRKMVQVNRKTKTSEFPVVVSNPLQVTIPLRSWKPQEAHTNNPAKPR